MTSPGKHRDHDRQQDRKRGGPRSSWRSKKGTREDDGDLLIYGIHAIEAALRNPLRTVRKLFLTENAERRLQEAMAPRQITHERVMPRDLDRRLGPDTVHQGALLETEPLPEPSLEDLADRAERGPLLVLDQVTDPHNVGAILRSAAAFGAAGLIMTRRHSPPLDGALAKAASGALDAVPVVLVPNLARGIADLKDLGFAVLGLDGDATEQLETAAWAPQVALVLGAEGKGLRQLTREGCDQLVRLSTESDWGSLNVSNAAAVALHWAAARRSGLIATR